MSETCQPGIDVESPDQEAGSGGDDYPYYNGRPVAISGAQWLFIVASVAVGFAVLTAPVPWFKGVYRGFIPAVLFPAIPLAALAIAAGRHWKAIFRPVGARDVGWMFVFWILNLIVTVGIGLLTAKSVGAVANPVTSMLAEATVAERVLFFLRTLPQLFGEEVLTVLPFLAVLWWTFARLGQPRGRAVVIAWVAASIMFGLAHLPTYDWNVAQCLMIIGTARLVLLLAYMKPKNIWVSTGAHVLTDWFIFGMSIVGAIAQQGDAPAG